MKKERSVTCSLPKDIDLFLRILGLMLATEGYHDALNKFRNLFQEAGISVRPHLDLMYLSCGR